MLEYETYIPVEELIRSGELGGREALMALAESDRYVFHGSPEKIETLEPRQAMSDGVPDGPPAVAATKNVETAIFRALVHKSLGHVSAWYGSGGQMYFLLTKNTMHDVAESGRIGWVYAMEAGDFAPFRGEWRSDVEQRPDFSIAVTVEDLPPDVIVFDTAEEMMAYYTQQNQAKLASKQEQGEPKT